MPMSFKELPNGGVAGGTSSIHLSVNLGKRVHIGQNVVIHEYVEIGDDAYIWDGSVIGRAPQRPNKQPARAGDRTIIGANTVIGTNTTIYSGTTIGKNVLIGDGVRIREFCTIQDDCIVGSNCTFQNEVFMGKGSRVIDLSHITAGVVIGEGAFVSTGVLTMNDDSFAGNNEKGEKALKPPIIGPFASVGGGAILLPGVEVGIRAVVAAGSTVTKNVDPDTVVMGVAAKRRYPSPVNENLRALGTTGYRPHDGDELVETPRPSHYGGDDDA